jgi:hypothetical protein
MGRIYSLQPFDLKLSLGHLEFLTQKSGFTEDGNWSIIPPLLYDKAEGSIYETRLGTRQPYHGFLIDEHKHPIPKPTAGALG